MLKKLLMLFFRNEFSMDGKRSDHKKVNLEYGNIINLGDSLTPVIVDWMLTKKKIDPAITVPKTKHLLAVGSLIGMSNVHFDATVWGTGILDFVRVRRFYRWKNLVKLDVRAVRGPITRELLLDAGYRCPEIYGDPAVLMPLIYMPGDLEKKYKVAIIHHHSQSATADSLPLIDIRTLDYKQFINRLVGAEKVISSSLHGVILAESYGIPAVFLNEGMLDHFQLIKIYDWYYSTGRMSVKIAQDLESALKMEAMPIPNLDRMQQRLIDTFPYDLWKQKI